MRRTVRVARTILTKRIKTSEAGITDLDRPARTRVGHSGMGVNDFVVNSVSP